jgi:ankyrin repeat protein
LPPEQLKSALRALEFLQCGFDRRRVALRRAASSLLRHTNDEYNELHLAILVGDERRVRELLEHGMMEANEAVNTCTGRGVTPLALAISAGRPAMVKLVQAAGGVDARLAPKK